MKPLLYLDNHNMLKTSSRYMIDNDGNITLDNGATRCKVSNHYVNYNLIMNPGDPAKSYNRLLLTYLNFISTDLTTGCVLMLSDPNLDIDIRYSPSNIILVSKTFADYIKTYRSKGFYTITAPNGNINYYLSKKHFQESTTHNGNLFSLRKYYSFSYSKNPGISIIVPDLGSGESYVISDSKVEVYY